MRSRIAPALLCAALAACIAGCGGGDGDATPGATGTAAAIPTATPFAQLPTPIIVTADAVPGAGSDVTYVVEPGDSLSVIASRYDTTVEALMEANGLSDNDIVVGQELIIPGGGAPSTGGGAPGPSATGTPEAGSADVYVVASGDTALGIVLRFDVTLEELAAANGMTVDEITNLHIGQQLQIPR